MKGQHMPAGSPCAQCEAMKRVLDKTQRLAYEHDKARIESDARARKAETLVETIRALVGLP